MKIRLAVIALIALTFWPSLALACQPTYWGHPRSSAQKLMDARQAIDLAFAIIDAKVVKSDAAADAPILLYAHRVLKGPMNIRWYSANYIDCVGYYAAKGMRARLFIYQDADGYTYVRSEDMDAESEYVDRILGSDRTKDFPSRKGQSK